MHKFKRIGSLLMALVMMVSLIPNAGAAEVYEDTGDDAYFDLNAEEYEFREDAGDQSIIVRRTGNLGVEVDVAFKIADFLTTYGEDYVVLDAAGKPLAKVDGVKPDVSDMTVEESDAGIFEEAPPAPPEAAIEEPPVETEPAATETPAEVTEEPAAVTTEEAATEEPAEVAEEAVETTEEAAEATEEAVETTEEAADVAETPVEATEEAVETTEEPAEATEEAVEATEEAVEATEEPAEETTEAAEVAEETAEAATEAVEDTAEQVVEVETDNDANMAALSEETAVLSDAAAVEEPADADAANVKRAYSTGSPLRDAAYGYLGIDGEQAELQSAEADKTAKEIEQLLTETNAYFQSAQGAEGVLHFDRGETEKAIVVRPTNDEQSNGTRVFLVALMGVREGQRGRVAPDANSYVSLIDDEDREAPAYSLAASNTTLTEDAPEATVIVTRTSGLADFSTAYLSTIKPTTDAAPTYEYQQFNGRSVQFLPGETEKEVTIKALYFDRSGKFGVRLEAADEDATFGNTYAEFTIRATDAEGELIPAAPEVELMAAPVEISEEPGEPKEAYEPAQLLDGSISMSRGNGGVWTGSANVSGKNQQRLTFVAPVTGNYTLESTNTNGGSSCDPYVHLYNSNRSEIATNDDGAGNRNFRISRQMNAGETYYYGVRYYYDSNSGNINLRLTLDPEGLSAPKMAGKTTGTATISGGGGEKIYSITPTVSGTYTFKSTNSSGDPYGYLYDANRNQLASNDDGAGNRNFLITRDLTAGTTYYLGVAFYGGSATGTVSFELAAPTPTSGPIGRASFSPDGMWNGSFSYDVWGTAKTGSDGDNYAYLSNNAIWVGQYDEDEYSYGYTKRPYDMTGVYKLRFYSSMGGDGNNFHTIFETDSDQSWPGEVNHESKSGKYSLQHTDLSVANQNRELYIKWGAKADDWGRQNPRGWLENVTFFYTFYRLNAKASVDVFQRKVYDFTSTTANGKSPQSFATYWDNPHQMAVAPGINLFGTTGFYANDVGTVLIEADDTAAQNGLTLAGVYLCRSSNLTSTPTSNYHYIAANSDGSVTFQNTQAFVRTLISANVVNSTNGTEENIYIYPKFTQKKVTVTFENANAENKSGGGRRYESGHVGSAFANIVALWEANGRKTAANDNGIIWKTTDSGKNDVYKVRLPWKSAVRLQVQPDPSATPNGIRYRTSYNGQSTVTSFTLGQRIYSSNTDGYTLVNTEDITKGEFVLDADEYLVAPNTNTQTFYVGYSPKSYASMRSQILRQTGRSDLTGVARVGSISDLSGQQETTTNKTVTDTTGMQTSSAEGSILIDPARTGDAYTVTAMAPDGYYTSWANMSEDRNNDGKKDADAPARSKASRSANPQYVYGDEINVQLDIDNMRYYYKFIKQMNEGSGELITGSVVRERNTFLRLVNHEPPIKGTPVKRNGKVINRPEVEGEPVAGANVSISGSYGMTNAMGEYEVEIPITEDWGAVSFRVSADGSNYYGQVYIEDEDGLTILPALERFTAKAASLSYARATSSISGSRAMITNDALTVMAQVTASGSITPAAARFYIYDKDGLVRVNCAEDPANYRVTFDRSTYKASMTWNPKQAMQAKDTVWVQFQDNTGKWYPPINMGYTFVNEISLNNFSLESVGGSTVDGAETTGETIDMIGNPIGNLGLGMLTGLNNAQNKTTSTYVPEGLSEDVEDEYAKTVTEFKFGFSPNISFEGKWKNGERQPPDPPASGVHLDDDTKDNLGDLNDLGNALFGEKQADGTRKRSLPSMDAPEGGGYATESKFSWSVQPQVGFKLTLSSRDGQEGVFVEDILVYLAVDAGLGAEYAVGLPLGFQLIVRLNLSGRIAGVYYMYNEYERTDLTQTSSGSTFNQEDLGLYGSAKEVQNHTRHEGYIFFDLNLVIGLGIKWTIFYVGGTASFGFDFDFKFDHDGTHAYGQFNYNFGVSVEVLGYEVWSKETEFDGVELFSKDADEPFDFDYAAEMQSAQLKALSSFSEGGSYAIDRTVNRDYLQNRTAWHGQPTVWERFASLFDAAPAGNGETVLQRGTANNPQMSLTKINDTELLMIFVGDVPTRTDANARAVFYAIGDGMTWSNPQILDDDGTIDDYPNVCDLGDGRLLVTWSSGNTVLAADATLEDSLKNLDIKATFFNKASKTFDTPVSLTHTTEQDYSADVMPHAAYDAETGRLLLTYTKTEYNNLSEQENLGRAVSVIAYLFYENGAWQNTGDAYTAAELDQIAAGQANPDTFKEEYKQQWYGQRFLDLRVDRNPNAPLLRVIESDAIAYNGLALNAWTVDWDGSLETTTDRDVFLQIYNFEENSFTHIIRVTEATGQHALPRFARSDNNTYLFYGAQDFDEETGELKENGEIRYLNVSEAVRNERYTLVETDTSRYYELKYQRPEQTVEGPDGNVTIPAEVVWYPTDIAAQCNNIADYTVFVDGNGQMYLFFSDMDEESHSRLIRASAYLGTDNESESESGSAADINGWTIPVYLTDGESVCYAGIGGVAVGSIIYLASGKSNYEDETDTSLVLVRHEPYAELTLDSVDASDDFPLPGGSTALTAVVRNIGLRSWTEPVEVTFNMTAKDKDGAVLSTADVTAQYDGMIIGGAEAQVTAYVDIPEAFDTLTFTATYNGETVTCERESGSFLAVTEDAIGVRVTDAGDRQQYASATVTNNGNKASGVIAISCYTGEDGYLNGGTLPSLAPGESASFDYSLVISDSAYTIDGDGIGLADIYASVVELEDDSVTLLDADDELTDPTQIESANGSEVARISGTAQKNFDAEAIQLLNDVTVPANIAFTVREDEDGPLQPTLGGANAEQLRVDWISTSDPAVATIDATNAILPHTAGTATLTGIVTPRRTNFVYAADGTSARQDWRDVIPEDMQREVTAQVTVLAAETVAEPDPAPEGSHNVVFDSAGGSAVTYQVVQDGQRATEPAAPTRTGYDFLGWQFDGENYDFSTAVTEDIQLTANWRRNDAATPGNPDNPGTDSGKKSGCYVATSVYGSYDCPEVWTLRRFRDETLAATWYGRLFIRAYYAVSPTAVKWFGNSEWFQNFFRDKLDTLVSSLQADGFESTPYDDLDW